MSDIARLALFAGTLGLAAAVALSRDPTARRRFAAAFLAAVLGFSIAAGLFRWDGWPFTRYAMLMYVPPGWETTEIAIVGVDAAGRERPVDPFAWSPLFPTALAAWVEREMPRLTDPERQQALTFLWERAERSRERLASGGRTGSARWLGAAGAPPDWGLYRRFRIAEPYRGLRIYRVRWTTGSEKRWTLLAEYAPL